MKKQDTPLTKDVETLVEKMTVEQAATEVISRFEQAVEALDRESQELLRNYLDGKTPRQLSTSRKLSEEQLGEWLDSIKREVIQHLRANCKVRQ